jgi:hypothetical protein
VRDDIYNALFAVHRQFPLASLGGVELKTELERIGQLGTEVRS